MVYLSTHFCLDLLAMLRQAIHRLDVQTLLPILVARLEHRHEPGHLLLVRLENHRWPLGLDSFDSARFVVCSLLFRFVAVRKSRL